MPASHLRLVVERIPDDPAYACELTLGSGSACGADAIFEIDDSDDGRKTYSCDAHVGETVHWIANETTMPREIRVRRLVA